MRKLVVGDCLPQNKFEQVDPTQFVEAEFEPEVVKALTCLMPEYRCGVFAGAFVHEGQRRLADLALLHRQLTHWFVVEVELAGHSLEQHVLPQVRCFRFGEPESTCATSLMRAFGDISRPQAEMILRVLPRQVAVVGNMPSEAWVQALRVLDVQYLTVSVFRDAAGRIAHEVQGRLAVGHTNLGFAQYSLVDNSLKIAKASGLPVGPMNVLDQFGSVSEWVVRDGGSALWIQKLRGPALIDHNAYVQILRDPSGEVWLRL